LAFLDDTRLPGRRIKLAQQLEKRPSDRPQFFEMCDRQSVWMGRKSRTHAAVIDSVLSSLDQSKLSQSIHQFHRTVRADQQRLRKIADGQGLGALSSLDCQKRLVLLRGQPSPSCRLRAECRELAQGTVQPSGRRCWWRGRRRA
jgi:hypothetical protein